MIARYCVCIALCFYCIESSRVKLCVAVTSRALLRAIVLHHNAIKREREKERFLMSVVCCSTTPREAVVVFARHEVIFCTNIKTIYYSNLINSAHDPSTRLLPFPFSFSLCLSFKLSFFFLTSFFLYSIFLLKSFLLFISLFLLILSLIFFPSLSHSFFLYLSLSDLFLIPCYV